jgi:hypothetical protein
MPRERDAVGKGETVMESNILNVDLRPEQRERLTAVIELLGKHWGPIASVTRSSGGIFGTFANVALSLDEIWSKVRADVDSSILAPRQLGGKAEVAHVYGDLPQNVQFMAKVWPAITPGQHNIEINLFPTLRPEERDAVRMEQIYYIFNQMLGKELQRPGILAEFVRRQLRFAGKNRGARAAEMAELIADELRDPQSK